MRQEISSEALHQQVEKFIPTKWYESTDENSAANSLSTIVLCVLLLTEIVGIGAHETDALLSTSLLSSIFYLICVSLDFVTTYRGLQYAEKLKQTHGTDYRLGVKEEHPDLRDVTTARDFARRCWTKTQTLAALCSILPPIGIGIGASRGFAALGNMRELRRLKLMEKIIDAQE